MNSVIAIVALTVIASFPYSARYRTRTLNRHRERSVAIHAFGSHGLPRYARNDEDAGSPRNDENAGSPRNDEDAAAPQRRITAAQ